MDNKEKDYSKKKKPYSFERVAYFLSIILVTFCINLETAFLIYETIVSQCDYGVLKFLVGLGIFMMVSTFFVAVNLLKL